MTYPSIEPYMKGIHLTAEFWRDNRDNEGWRVDEDPRLITLDDDTGEYIMEEYTREPSTKDPPSDLKPVPRLLLDVHAIRSILKGPTPIMRLLCP
jgi:hypothetical protein